MLSLHPLLADRRSSRAFDAAAEVTSQELASLLEAARWAPSNRNSQPWRFAIGRRDDEIHKRIFATLTEDNQRWALQAPVLLVGAYVTGATDRPLPHAEYDLGQAVAHLTVQAAFLGLRVRQMGGFDRRALHTELALSADVRPHVVVAVGRPGDLDSLPADIRDKELAARTREPIGAILLT